MSSSEERYRQIWNRFGGPGAILILSDRPDDRDTAIVAGHACKEAASIIGIDPVPGDQGPVIQITGRDIDQAIVALSSAGFRVLYGYRVKGGDV